MRHNKKFNHLGRKKAHREAMLSNMAASLILHKRIFTTVAKAKALRVYVEPLLTRAKEDSTHARRIVFAELQNKFAVKELFGPVAEKIADRPGGYTRILKTGNRLGDNAAICFIELVDYNENMLKEKADKKAAPKTRRSRRSTKATAPRPTGPKTRPPPGDIPAARARCHFGRRGHFCVRASGSPSWRAEIECLSGGAKVTSTGRRSDQYWSLQQAVLVTTTYQYWSRRRPVLVAFPVCSASLSDALQTGALYGACRRRNSGGGAEQ